MSYRYAAHTDSCIYFRGYGLREVDDVEFGPTAVEALGEPSPPELRRTYTADELARRRRAILESRVWERLERYEGSANRRRVEQARRLLERYSLDRSPGLQES